MWEPAKRWEIQWQWSIGACLLAAVLVGASVWHFYGEGASPQVSTIAKSSVVRSSVEQSWENRSVFNDAFAHSKTSAGNLASPQTISSQLSSLAPQIQSVALRKVMGLEGSGTYTERMKNLSLLKKPLSTSDQRWLYGFLASSERITGMSDPAAHALKDGIMVFLTNDQQPLAQTVEILRQMYLDPAQDNTIRTYAVQYLANSLPQLTDNLQRVAVQQLLETISKDPSQIGSGAALLGLERTTAYDSTPVSTIEVSQLALKTASDVNVPQMQRMHPLQICGQMDVQEAAPVARDLVVNGTHAMVRMAALATLGQLGQVTDLPLLTKAASDPDDRIRYAANAALIVLKSRLNQ